MDTERDRHNESMRSVVQLHGESIERLSGCLRVPLGIAAGTVLAIAAILASLKKEGPSTPPQSDPASHTAHDVGQADQSLQAR